MSDSETPSPATRRVAVILGMGVLLLVQLLTVEIDPLWGRPVGADAQEMLYLGQVLDRGGSLYLDVAHPGFPAVGLLGYLCLRLGELLGVLPTTALVLLYLVWSLTVATTVRAAVMRRGLGDAGADLFFVAVYAILVGFPTQPMLAQPESFVAAALLPVFLFSGAPRGGAAAERLGGLLAGLSLWLEPALALLPLAFVVRDLAVEPARLRRPLYQGLLLGGALGSASLLAIADLEAFWRWGPGWRLGAGRALTAGWGGALEGALLEGWYVGSGLLVALPIGLARGPRGLRGALVDGSAGAAMALLLAVLLGEGHAEHHLPWLLLAFVTGFLAAQVGLFPGGADRRDLGAPSGREAWLVPLVAVLLALGGVGGWCAKIGKYRSPETLERALEGLPPGEAVTVLTNDVPTDPLTPYRLGRGQGTRFTWARYLVPSMRDPSGAAARAAPPASAAELDPGQARVVRLLLGDLERSRPAALLLERVEGATDALPVSVEAYLLAMDETASFLRGRYVPEQELPSERYRRYLRRDLVAP